MSDHSILLEIALSASGIVNIGLGITAFCMGLNRQEDREKIERLERDAKSESDRYIEGRREMFKTKAEYTDVLAERNFALAKLADIQAILAPEDDEDE